MEILDTTVLEIWELFCEQLPPGKRSELAVRYMRIFLEQEIELEELDDIRGEDEHLDHAFDQLSDDEGEDEEYGDDE